MLHLLLLLLTMALLLFYALHYELPARQFRALHGFRKILEGLVVLDGIIIFDNHIIILGVGSVGW